MTTNDGPTEVRIRPVRIEDAAELHRLLVANREHLAPTSPAQADSYFTFEGQQASVAEHVAKLEAGTGASYVTVVDGRIVGRISLSSVLRGPLQSAVLGYWTDRDHQGAGIATRAVGLIVGIARDELRLHRLEAGTLVDNEASQLVLLRNDFEEYGLARQFLRINGQWRDHRLFHRILDE